MSDKLEKCKIISASYIDFADGRYVGLADLEYTETNTPGKCLLFRSKSGNISEVSLSAEAYEALKQLMFDPNSGTSGTKALAVVKGMLEETQQAHQIVWKLVSSEDVEAARLAAKGDTQTQTG